MLNYLAPEEQNLVLDVLQAPLGRMLHGEQRFFYERPVYVGDRIRLSTRIADIYDKKGGALEFIVLDTSFHNQRDELCAISSGDGVFCVSGSRRPTRRCR